MPFGEKIPDMYRKHILNSSPEQLKRELDSLERTKQFNASEARQKIYFVKERLDTLLSVGDTKIRNQEPNNKHLNWSNDRLLILDTCSFPPGVPYPEGYLQSSSKI